METKDNYGIEKGDMERGYQTIDEGERGRPTTPEVNEIMEPYEDDERTPADGGFLGRRRLWER